MCDLPQTALLFAFRPLTLTTSALESFRSCPRLCVELKHGKGKAGCLGYTGEPVAGPDGALSAAEVGTRRVGGLEPRILTL